MYNRLLEPGKIGTMSLHNHIIMGPTETHFTSADGTVSQKEIDYYVRRARGGVGLIVTHQTQGNTKIDPIDPYPRSARLDDDAFIPMMSELTEAVHLEGAKISVLLSPGGGAQALGVPYDTGSAGVNNFLNVAPGNIPCPVAQKKVRKLTVDEIKQSVKIFGMSAGRAKRAGFDAITIHAHCGYLIAEFLSPYFNNRDDEYGGSLENRARFLLELIAETKKNVGDSFPVIVRLAIDEYIGEAGREIEETLELVKMLEKAGVDAIDCGAGLFMTMPLICPTIYHEKGCFTNLSEAVKSVVNIPVIVQGRLQDPELAEQVLEEEKADFISLSRAWIAEPDWANKVKANDIEGIRRCISCNHCIGDRICGNLTVRCTLNPLAGRESKYDDTPKKAKEKKSIAIIGAGPGGLEAAYRCGLCGHKVDLYEKTGELCGGQIMAAKASPGKEVLNNIPRFYSEQLRKLDNVTIHLNYDVTKENLKDISADVVILATGGQPLMPGIPGLKECENVATAADILTGKKTAKGKVLVAGGGQAGIETAYYLKAKGFDVDIIEMLPEIALNEELMTRITILPMIEKMGIKSYTSHQIMKVNATSLLAKDLVSGEEKEIPFDTLVMALGTKPVQDLKPELENAFSEYYIIGDANATGTIRSAITNAYFTSLKI